MPTIPCSRGRCNEHAEPSTARWSPAPLINLIEKIARVEFITRAAGVVRSQSETMQVSNPVRFEAANFLFVNLLQSTLV
jgi:hypothetical protein